MGGDGLPSLERLQLSNRSIYTHIITLHKDTTTKECAMEIS